MITSPIKMRHRIAAFITVIVSISAAIALAVYLVAKEQFLIAALWVLPFVVLVGVSLSRSRSFSWFVLSRSIGGPMKAADEPERSYQFRLARWWALGALVLPSSLLLLDFSLRRAHLLGEIEALLALPLPTFGGVCFVMCLVSVVRGLQRN